MIKRESLFIKAAGIIILLSLITGTAIMLLDMKERTEYLEKVLVEENKSKTEIIACGIEDNYLADRWPFCFLKQLSDYEDVLFWWIVKPNREIYLANETEVIGKKTLPLQVKPDEIVVKDSSFYKTGERIKLIIHPLKIGEKVDEPWLFYLGVSLESLEASKKKVIITILQLFGGILMLVVILFLFFAKKFIDPIKKLTKGAEIIGKGNLDYRIKLDADDEFEDLAKSFNWMTGKLKEQREREKAISKMKSEFISVAAHQLRTPVSSLKWALDFLRQGKFGKINDKQKEYLEDSYNCARNMEGLVNSFLNVAEIEGGLSLKYSKVQIENLIQQVIEEVKRDAEKKKINIIFQKLSSPLPLIKIDAQKIRVVIRNLLDNAIKYTLENGKISLFLEKEKEEIIVKIEDTGIGIPKAREAEIFTKFFRAKNAMSLQPHGSGLGLYIVKSIITGHGGKTWCRSEENVGTTFYFSLPIKD